MIKKLRFLFWLNALVVMLASCGKEYSFEFGASPSVGSLQEETSGDCLPKTINGTYEQGVAVTGSNSIDVTIDVTTPGAYLIYTDTVHGVFFRAQGFFTTRGVQSVKLTASGTPNTAGISNFEVRYNGQSCFVSVPVLPSGASGPAVYTFTGAPGNCSGGVANGIYGEGVALNSTNTLTVTLDVTTIGTYTITTTTNNGITFSGTGAVITTGPQTVTLQGSGTPAAAGSFNIAIATAAPGSCTVPLTVLGPAQYTADCATATVNGTYTQGVALTAANTITLSVTATTAGAYSITVPAVNGISFSATGQLTVGSNTITLRGAGTPAASGPATLPFTAGSTNCNVTVNVATAPPPTDLKWTLIQGSNNFGGDATALLVTAGGSQLLEIGGANAGAPPYTFQLRISSTTLGVGSYTSASGAVTMLLMNGVTPVYMSMPTQPFTVNITTFNTTTGVVQGTYNGKAMNSSAAFVDVSGTFKAIM
ncbi:MAG: hypothetical protein ABS85_11535 [Sphingobacteriales bacterium SCN 48-20]|uniref:hypothetical protein n=1 Tax=Terrimonas ferruginea TaxID=249 RepID=UPI00086E38C6|nr:hypothetical protein [Terrimonas ferruginea]MBN8784856.1 hypothetical protein [Terrimonas ferruginea]ODT91827.1 MAG: hypothetical protein ABS85_11535 [Sphingobacteriales bacterium SCN 48-20]OJW43740.1 MAG: hypothetical protein BGO56_05425 [Sphingobacteriales bacterium 48-107]